MDVALFYIREDALKSLLWYAPPLWRPMSSSFPFRAPSGAPLQRFRVRRFRARQQAAPLPVLSSLRADWWRAATVPWWLPHSLLYSRQHCSFTGEKDWSLSSINIPEVVSDPEHTMHSCGCTTTRSIRPTNHYVHNTLGARAHTDLCVFQTYPEAETTQ